MGKKASSFKLMGKINNPGGCHVTVTLGRTDQVSQKTARAEAQEIRLKPSRGEDPRRMKTEVPTLARALERWRSLDRMEDRVRRVCWIVMLLCGLRCGDARSIKWEHIDADGVLTVPSPKGGEAKAFKLPLPRFVRQELEEVRELTRPLWSPDVFASATAKSGHIEQMCRTSTSIMRPTA